MRETNGKTNDFCSQKKKKDIKGSFVAGFLCTFKCYCK